LFFAPLNPCPCPKSIQKSAPALLLGSRYYLPIINDNDKERAETRQEHRDCKKLTAMAQSAHCFLSFLSL